MEYINLSINDTIMITRALYDNKEAENVVRVLKELIAERVISGKTDNVIFSMVEAGKMLKLLKDTHQISMEIPFTDNSDKELEQCISILEQSIIREALAAAEREAEEAETELNLYIMNIADNSPDEYDS